MRYPKSLGHALLGIALVASSTAAAPDVLTRAEAQARAARVGGVAYDLTLKFTSGQEKYEGSAGIRFRTTGSGPLFVDFRSDGVQTVRLDGKDLGRAVADGVRVLLPTAALPPGDHHLEVTWKHDFDRSGSGLYRFVDPLDSKEYTYSDLEPFYAHRIFPCFDQPDLKGTVKLQVRAPRPWQVVANELETTRAPQSDGTDLWTFPPTPPLPTYVLFVGAGDYVKVEGPTSPVPLRLFVRASQAGHLRAQEFFTVTGQGMKFFPEFFGTPYPYKKYDQLFVPDFNSGAMENAGAVTFAEKRLYRHQPTRLERLDLANVVLHELAHQWFGDLVTMRWWDGLWLNESFATYMASLGLVRATEFSEGLAQLLLEDRAWALEHDQRVTTHPVAGPCADTDAAFAAFDGITYGKGGALLAQLHHRLGDKGMRDGLALYFRRHAMGNTETTDFFSCLGRGAGQNLTRFQAEHVQTAGANRVRVELGVQAGRVTGATLVQEPGNGHSQVRTHHLQVATFRADGHGDLVVDQIVPLVTSAARTELAALVGQRAPDLVWPDHGAHAYVRVALDPVSLTTVRHRLSRVRDPLVRRGLWMSLWDSVRAAQVDPRIFLETFLEHAALEDPAVVHHVGEWVLAALQGYVDRDRDQWRERVNEWAMSRLRAAVPRSDGARVAFDLFVPTAEGTTALLTLERWFDGRGEPPPLELSADRKGEILVRLASQAWPGVRTRRVRLQDQDKGDQGRRWALKSEAAVTNPATKAVVWNRLFTDTTLSLTDRKAMMEAFVTVDRPGLLAPFVPLYFDRVAALTVSSEPELAEAIVSKLFPAATLDPSVSARARAMAADSKLGPDLKKSLAAGADELDRTLRIRARYH